MIRLSEVFLHSGTSVAGWRAAPIREAILAGFALPADRHTLNRRCYDLRKWHPSSPIGNAGSEIDKADYVDPQHHFITCSPREIVGLFLFTIEEVRI